MAGRDVGYYALPIIPSIEGIGPAIDKKLGRAFDGISKTAGKSIAGGVTDGLKEAEAAVKSSSNKISALRSKEADAVGKLRVAEEKLKEVRESGKTGSTLARAEEAREKALRGQVSAMKSVQSETRSLKRAEAELADARKNFGRGGPSMDAGKFLSGIGDTSGLTGRFRTIGVGAGGAFAAGAVLAIAAGGFLEAGSKAAGLVMQGFESIFDTGLDFSKTMNNFQGVTRASSAEMAQMQQRARALGSDTTLAGASASDAALAMTELAKAGFSVDDSMTAARGTLELATAGQIDAAKAAEIQSNAMNAFGLQAGDAAHVADLLANAAIASSADIPDIGMALAQVGGVAKGFGENLDDTIAALGMFANAGVKGSDAGTLLKTTMQSITDQGNPAQGAIHELGLELYKLNGQGQNQFVGFRELFKQLDEAKKRLNDPEQFQALTNVLFGSDAMRSAMLGTAEGFDEMFTKLQRVGAAGEMANAQMQGLPGAVEGLKNAWEGIQLGAFDMLGPALTGPIQDMVQYLSEHKADVIDFFVNVGDSAMTMGEAILSTIAASSRVMANFADLVGADDTAKSLRFAADASEEAFGALMRGQDKLAQYGDRAKEATKVTDALGDSVSSLKVVGNAITLDVKENTPEVQAKLATLGAHLQAMADDPTRLEIVADTTTADHSLNAYRQQQQGTPIEVPFTVHYDVGKSLLPDWFKYIGGGNGAAPLPVGIIPSGGPQAPIPTSAPPVPMPSFKPRADGGMFPAMPSSATIHPEKRDLIMWAEPGTGGEAYIPMNGGQRSIDIWEQAGRQLGVWKFEQGGFRGLQALYSEAQSLSGHTYSRETGDDCSGTMSQLVNAALGLPPKGDRMATGNAAQWLAGKGALPGMGPDGTFRLGWKNGGPGGGHMAGTLPDGTHVEQGGSTNGFTIGGNAAGADDPQFTDHAYLPLEALFPDGVPSGGVVSPFGGSTVGSAGGGSGLAGAGGGGGSWSAPDAKAVRDAEQKVADADTRLKIQEQQLRELKADASESSKMQQQADVDKARREAADARADLAEVQKGKFKAGKSGGAGGSDVSELGSIFGSFMKETFGLDGSLFPDIGNLAPVKMLGTLLGAFGGGNSADGATPGVAGFGAGGGNFPFGMIPSGFGPGGVAAAGMAPPGSPASGVGFGPPPGPPAPVDQSTNVSVTASPGMEAIADTVRRQVLNVNRLGTYTGAGTN